MSRTRSAIVCAMPADGHVRPMLSVARGLRDRGWRVRFLTGAAYAGAVTEAGIEHVCLPPAADTMGGLPADERPRGLAAVNRGLAAAFLDPAPHAARALLALLEEEPAAAVLYDVTFVGAVGLESLPPGDRPLRVACGIIPLGLSSPDAPPYGMGLVPWRGRIGRLRNRLLHRIATRVALRPAHRQVERMLADLGAAPLDGAFFFDIAGRAEVFAQFTVPEFEYPRRDAPTDLHFLGPVSRLAPSTDPLPDWWGRLVQGVPVVHVSQGTVATADFGELVEPTLAGLADEDVLVVVSTGGAPLDRLPKLPANAVAAEYLPYDRLFPLTSVFVTNGGYGGLHYAMEHGTPIVVAGETEDKPETAARVAWSGVGVRLRTGRPSAEQVRRAVRTVLEDPAYAERSARVGAAIRESGGLSALADLLESRVPQPSRGSGTTAPPPPA